MSKDHHSRHKMPGGAAPFVDLNAEVARLISSQKMKQAVELAKEHHKRVNTTDSEKLLVDAYISRIGQFQSKGQEEDALTMIALVKQRYPTHAGRLEVLQISTAASAGLVDELVAPLARRDLPNAEREAIDTAIRQRLLDLQGLAESKSLPAEHPLKVAAVALWRAFDASTSGPVTDEQIALPEVSRKSPLAGWRMLIRAIAALHRNDDDGCRRALEAIPADAAVARLAPVMLDIISNAPPARGAVGALQSRVSNSDDQLRAAINKVDREFGSRYLDVLMSGIFSAVRACDISRPELTDQLRRRIAARCLVEQVPLNEVRPLLTAISLDAAFWRLMANADERSGAPVTAVISWERFLRHAVHEKLFAPAGMEAAQVYLHMAVLLAQVLPDELARVRSKMGFGQPTAFLYKNQPPAIAALAPAKDTFTWALNPNALFQRSTQIMADAEAFKVWAELSKANDEPVKFREDIYQAWHKALPRDVEPILQLSALAEDRNALQLATKRLVEAEAIDSFNPMVRKARIRLTLSTLWRHMKDQKPHLVEKDIAELEKLPAFGEGDHNLFLQAVKAVCHAMRNEPDAARKAADDVLEKMGTLAGTLLLFDVERASGIKTPGRFALAPVDPDPLGAAKADARVRRLCTDLQISVMQPEDRIPLVLKVMLQRPCPLGLDDILTLGTGAYVNDHLELAYAASSAGMDRATGPALARILVIRARAVSQHSQGRMVQCLRAALALASRVHDSELMDAINREMAMLPRYLRSPSDGKPLEPQMLEDILKAERQAGEVPRTRAAADKHVVLIDKGPPLRGGGFYDNFDAVFGEDDDDEFDDDDDDDGHDFDASTAFGVPNGKEVSEILETIFKKYGRLPTPAEMEREAPGLAAELLDALEKSARRKP